MKYIKSAITTVLFLGLVFATQAKPINPLVCKGIPQDVIVLLPNPEDCSSYFECANQEPILMPCPDGLHWNAGTRKCDFPEVAKCVINNHTLNFNKIWSGCEAVPENIDVLLPNPADCGTYIQCVHQKPMVRPCPIGLHWSVSVNRCEYPENANCKSKSCEGVPETEDVLLPNPNDCGTYIQCVHQKPVVRPCPSGTHWSVTANQCDWPLSANCTSLKSSRSIIPTKKFTSCESVPSNIDILLPNPGDCGTYIQCVHQKPMVRPCPTGLHWSVSLNRCEYPETANCKSKTCEGVPETEDVLLPNPNDCGTYIQCVHQKPVVRPCAAGTHWSVTTNRCEFPNVAKCES